MKLGMCNQSAKLALSEHIQSDSTCWLSVTVFDRSSFLFTTGSTALTGRLKYFLILFSTLKPFSGEVVVTDSNVIISASVLLLDGNNIIFLEKKGN